MQLKKSITLLMLATASVNAADAIPSGWSSSPEASSTIYLEADLLKWYTRADAMPYTWVVAPLTSAPDFYSTEKLQPKFDWNTGLRLEAAFITPVDRIDISVAATFIKTNPHSKVVSSKPNLALVNILPSGQLLPFGGALLATEVDLSWDLDFSALHFEIGRKGSLGDHLQLRPHFGLKWIEMTQNMSSNYLGVTDFSVDPAVSRGSRFFQSSTHFTAIGPRTGLDATWALWGNFGLTGEVAGSFVLGRFETGASVITKDTTLDPNPIIEEEKYRSFDKGAALAELFFGAVFSIERGSKAVSLTAGYEANYLWEVVAIPHKIEGDLSMQGLTAKLNLRF